MNKSDNDLLFLIYSIKQLNSIIKMFIFDILYIKGEFNKRKKKYIYFINAKRHWFKLQCLFTI